MAIHWSAVLDDQVWNSLHPTEKNSFLHFADDAALTEKRSGLQCRRHSEPACLALATQLMTVIFHDQAWNTMQREDDALLHSDDEEQLELADEQIDHPVRRKSELAQLVTVHLDDQVGNNIEAWTDEFLLQRNSLHASSLHSVSEAPLAQEHSDTPVRCSSLLAHLPTVHVDAEEWNTIQIEKNTFLHFVDETSCVEERLRRRSEPACCAELWGVTYPSKMYESTEAPDSPWSSEGAESIASQIDALDISDASILEHSSKDPNANISSIDMLGKQERYCKGFAFDEESLNAFGGETRVVDDVNDDCPRSCSKGGLNRKGRPCKGKRDRFRKFVARMQAKIEADPHGCDLENIEWPAVLLVSELGRIRIKVEGNMRAYRSRLLAELPCYSVNQATFTLSIAQFL